MAPFRADRTGAAVTVGSLEAQVLEAIWAQGPVMLVPEVHRALTSKGRALSYSAVKAVLNNLANKGLLRKDKVGKVTRFELTQSREEFEAAIISDVIAGLKRNYGAPVIAQLVGELAVDEESLDALDRLIAARREELKS